MGCGLLQAVEGAGAVELATERGPGVGQFLWKCGQNMMSSEIVLLRCSGVEWDFNMISWDLIGFNWIYGI